MVALVLVSVPPGAQASCSGHATRFTHLPGSVSLVLSLPVLYKRPPVVQTARHGQEAGCHGLLFGTVPRFLRPDLSRLLGAAVAARPHRSALGGQLLFLRFVEARTRAADLCLDHNRLLPRPRHRGLV